MIVLAAFDSVLPMAESLILEYNGRKDTILLVFYEGKGKDVYCTRRLFELSLPLQSLTRRKEITAKLASTEDGTLTATISEESGNVEQCYSPQILGRRSHVH